MVKNDKSIHVTPTLKGTKIFKHSSLYHTFFNYFDFLINLDFKNDNTHARINKILHDYENIENHIEE